MCVTCMYYVFFSCLLNIHVLDIKSWLVSNGFCLYFTSNGEFSFCSCIEVKRVLLRDGTLRSNNRKRVVESGAKDCDFSVSEFSEESFDEWWDDLSKKIVGNPSSSILDHFKFDFQMSRNTFDYICSLVKNCMTTETHFTFTNGNPMSVTDQVAIALRRLGSGNSLVTIGESFGVHHYTVSQVTWRFVEAIEENAVHHIRWPSKDEMSQIKCKFEKIRGLPNCCGAVDTTHVKVHFMSSNQEADIWSDRSGFHSMILQAIVEPDLRFRDVVTGWPGKMSYFSVLQNSSFFRSCEEGRKLNGLLELETMTLSEYIVGDLGFPLLPWLVTPYRGQELSNTKVELNKRLIATHDVACKALSRLKEVWRIIEGKMWRPDRQRLPRIILVCCILHNIIIDMEYRISNEMTNPLHHDRGYTHEVCGHVGKGGSALRKRLSKYVSG